MMREEDKPFVCYKRGWQMNIQPRNAEGWRQFGLWMLGLLPIVLPFVWVMKDHPKPALVAVYVIAFVAAMGAWAFNMVRWMLPRSQIIEGSPPNRRK
ncbi:MAG: hypothetical protein ACKOPQ_09495 [Novosphingobium sp.]